MRIAVFPRGGRQEKTIRHILAEALSGQPYELRFVGQLSDKASLPDVVLIDTSALRQPTRDLPALLSTLKQSAWSNAPVILLDEPDAEVLYGCTDGYDARICLSMEPTQIAQLLDSVGASHTSARA
ncbi:MAG: hypothetical protein NZM28_10465 [Fimbriimonadales bacterium]|nr:hypothetical protein [Fimbriimonadales bacterium]